MIPRDLTLPEQGSTTAHAVLSRAIGRLFADLRTVLRGPFEDERLRRDISSLNAALQSIPDRQAALGAALRRPNLGALVRCARVSRDPSLVAELVATLAVELSAMGALRGPLTLYAAPARIVSLAGRRVIEGRRPLTLGPELDGRAAFIDIDRDIVLALEDNNPLSMLEAHPRKSGNRIDLGERSVGEWTASLRDALERIDAHLPDLRREIDLFVQQFVPVGWDESAHLSASYREAIGTIYLTLHPQAMTMTEAVIHEFSHNKINALFEIDDVLHNAFHPLFKSPVRPDPRPLHGVLLAVHAFIPVARLYERMQEAGDPVAARPGFQQRFRDIIRGNNEGMEVLLANADPTPAGRALLDELARWNEHFVRLLES